MTESTLFAEAISRPPEERAAFLDKACGDDAELRKRVEKLLCSHDEANSYLAGSAEEDFGETIAFSPDEQAQMSPQVSGPEQSPVADSGGANPDAPVPFIFGHRIAQGGMGAILEADDCKFGRKIAVKVMLEEAGQSEEQKKRFVQEAAVLGKLEHPNIVPVHDLGRDSSGDLYYSMKLVKGRTLQDVINDLREEDPEVLAYYTLDRLLTIFRKVCDAIAFAHAESIIHRDLKPENIMVGEFGEVLVMDWGISKILDGSAELIDPQSINPQAELSDESDITATLEGSVMGTPQYMSPEQAAGEIGEMDARSDIYSLGGILYAILTLRPPVEGTNVYEILDKVQTGDLTPITAWQKTNQRGARRQKSDILEAKKINPLPHIEGGRVPPALSSVAMKALALTKADRYHDVASFSEDIEKWQGGFATSAEQAGLGKQIALLIKRNKGIFTTAAAAWALITALAVWFVLGIRASEQAARASEAVALVEKEAARRSAAEANLALADAALREGNGREMQAALHDVPEDLRDGTWSYLLGQSDTSIAGVGIDNFDIQHAAADPTRPGVFAVAASGGRIAVLNVRTGERLSEFKAVFTENASWSQMCLAFSPDGERIAVGRFNVTGGIFIHRARDGKKLAGWAAPKSRELQFNADGTLLMQRTGLVENRRDIAVWDAATGQLRWKYLGKTGFSKGAFTPDGKQVLTVARPDGLRVVNALDGTLVRKIPARIGTDGMGMAVSALATNGADLVAIADLSQKITIVNWRLGEVVGLSGQKASENSNLRDLAWTPDGRQLIVAATVADGTQSIRAQDPLTGLALRSFLGGHGDVRAFAVHPLSGELVVSGPNARAWSLSGEPPQWSFEGAVEKRFAFFGSDDLIFGPEGSRAAVLKLQSAGSTVLWRHADPPYKYVSVSADGRVAALLNTYHKEDPTIILNRSNGQIKELAPLRKSILGHRVRLSPSGDQIISLRFPTSSEMEWLSTATGKSQGTLELADVKGITELIWFNGQRILGLVTAKAARLSEGSEEWIVLWDATTGKILHKATNRTAMDVLAVAPGGSRFAEAGADKMVRIRDGETLAVLQEFRAHDGSITSLAWHPTKPVVATASADLSIRIWDLDSGRMLEELRASTKSFRQLAFSPSGRRLGGVSDSGDERIWEPPSLNKPPATP